VPILATVSIYAFGRAGVQPAPNDDDGPMSRRPRSHQWRRCGRPSARWQPGSDRGLM